MSQAIVHIWTVALFHKAAICNSWKLTDCLQVWELMAAKVASSLFVQTISTGHWTEAKLIIWHVKCYWDSDLVPAYLTFSSRLFPSFASKFIYIYEMRSFRLSLGLIFHLQGFFYFTEQSFVDMRETMIQSQLYKALKGILPAEIMKKCWDSITHRWTNSQILKQQWLLF